MHEITLIFLLIITTTTELGNAAPVVKQNELYQNAPVSTEISLLDSGSIIYTTKMPLLVTANCDEFVDVGKSMIRTEQLDPETRINRNEQESFELTTQLLPISNIDGKIKNNTLVAKERNVKKHSLLNESQIANDEVVAWHDRVILVQKMNAVKQELASDKLNTWSASVDGVSVVADDLDLSSTIMPKEEWIASPLSSTTVNQQPDTYVLDSQENFQDIRENNAFETKFGMNSQQQSNTRDTEHYTTLLNVEEIQRNVSSSIRNVTTESTTPILYNEYDNKSATPKLPEIPENSFDFATTPIPENMYTTTEQSELKYEQSYKGFTSTNENLLSEIDDTYDNSVAINNAAKDNMVAKQKDMEATTTQPIQLNVKIEHEWNKLENFREKLLATATTVPIRKKAEKEVPANIEVSTSIIQTTIPDNEILNQTTTELTTEKLIPRIVSSVAADNHLMSTAQPSTTTFINVDLIAMIKTEPPETIVATTEGSSTVIIKTEDPITTMITTEEPIIKTTAVEVTTTTTLKTEKPAITIKSATEGQTIRMTSIIEEFNTSTTLMTGESSIATTSETKEQTMTEEWSIETRSITEGPTTTATPMSEDTTTTTMSAPEKPEVTASTTEKLTTRTIPMVAVFSTKTNSISEEPIFEGITVTATMPIEELPTTTTIAMTRMLMSEESSRTTIPTSDFPTTTTEAITTEATTKSIMTRAPTAEDSTPRIVTTTVSTAETESTPAPVPVARSLSKPVSHIERIFNEDGVEILFGYSSVQRNKK